MTDTEVNKVIAEYMGAEFYDTHDPAPVLFLGGCELEIDGFDRYTKSLDALVPVWEKLHLDHKAIYDGIVLDINMLRYGKAVWFEELTKYDGLKFHHMASSHNTIQQAAAHATAKAIKGLSNE